ncbi:MAG TPA: GTP cyclohydrolase I [Candidatus Acidoferrales bacterium]|nr:GTP cyclohydrolase I [Candidatus Acidoferrales bacterium]
MGNEEVRSRNGNGKPTLGAANAAVVEIESVPEGLVSGMHVSTARTRDDKLEPIVKLLLEELGVDVDSQHFRETPARVARFYREFTRGLSAKPQDILKTFRSPAHELVVVSGIDFFSLCPHHLLVYGGKIHFGYA